MAWARRLRWSVSGTSGCPWRSRSPGNFRTPSGSTSTRTKIDELRAGHDRTGEHDPAALRETTLRLASRSARPRGPHVLRGRRADAGRSEQPSRPDADHPRIRDRRPGPLARAPSWSTSRRSTRASPRRSAGRCSSQVSGLRPGVGLQARLLARADQPGRPASTPSSGSPRSCPGRTPRRSSASRNAYGRVVAGRRPPRAVDQGRRGGQGHREHPARPQHRADERARADLRPHRASAPPTCSRRPGRSGTSCRSRPGSSAATASASTRTT